MQESEIRPRDLFNRYLELSREEIPRFFGNPRSFLEVPCPACGVEDHAFEFDKFGFRYVTCTECGSLYVSPRPAATIFEAYYRESEAVKFWGNDFFKQTAEARRETIFRPRAELVAHWADTAGIGSHDTFVDIGAGYGVFLEEVERLGRFGLVRAVEPAPNLAAICRGKGFSVIEKTLEAVTKGEVEASFATAFEVLEHLHDPLVFVSAARHVLKPSGLLMMTTLTSSGFDIQVLWEHSKSVYPPHHINLLSLSGIRRLMHNAGFEILDLSTPGMLDVDIVRNCASENPQIPLPRFVRQIIGAPNETRSCFQDFLRTSSLSSHIRVIARLLEDHE